MNLLTGNMSMREFNPKCIQKEAGFEVTNKS